jgi:hypothetical protein
MDISKLKKYRYESYIKNIKHTKASKIYQKIDTIFSIVNIALVSISGVATNVTSDNNPFYSTIISGFIYCSLFVTGVQKYLNYGELSSKHQSSALGYSLLYMNIRDNINEPSVIFVTQFQVLDSISPDLPESAEGLVIEDPDDNSSSSSESASIDAPSYNQQDIRIEIERLRNL